MANIPDNKEQKKLGLRKPMWRRWALVFFVVALLVAGGWYAYSRYQMQKEYEKYVFSINEKKYLRSEFITDHAKPGNNKMSQSDFMDKYLDLKKKQYVAEKNNIQIDPDALDKKVVEIFPDQKNVTFDQLDIIRQKSVYDSVLMKSINITVAGSYEGAVFIFPFDAHITDYEGHLSSRTDGSKAIGIISAYDPAQVEVDKKYAMDKAQYYHDGIKNGSISIDQAIKEIKADKKLQNVNFANQSTTFKSTATSSWRDIMRVESIADYISEQKVPLLSDIRTDQVKVTNKGQTSNVDAQYYFVKLSKVPSSTASQDANALQEQINNQVKQLKVVVYGQK